MTDLIHLRSVPLRKTQVERIFSKGNLSCGFVIDPSKSIRLHILIISIELVYYWFELVWDEGLTSI